MSCRTNTHERIEGQHFLLIIMNTIGVVSDIWVARLYNSCLWQKVSLDTTIRQISSWYDHLTQDKTGLGCLKDSPLVAMLGSLHFSKDLFKMSRMLLKLLRYQGCLYFRPWNFVLSCQFLVLKKLHLLFHMSALITVSKYYKLYSFQLYSFIFSVHVYKWNCSKQRKSWLVLCSSVPLISNA